MGMVDGIKVGLVLGFAVGFSDGIALGTVVCSMVSPSGWRLALVSV